MQSFRAQPTKLESCQMSNVQGFSPELVHSLMLVANARNRQGCYSTVWRVVSVLK